MPIYEFNCQSCTHDSEVLICNRSQKPRCPECGSTKMKKHLSDFAAGKAGVKTPPPACSAILDRAGAAPSEKVCRRFQPYSSVVLRMQSE